MLFVGLLGVLWLRVLVLRVELLCAARSVVGVACFLGCALCVVLSCVVCCLGLW